MCAIWGTRKEWLVIMYIKRNIEEKMKEASQQFASITIYGSRQVGKSTLIENIFPNIKYVTLDDIEIMQSMTLKAFWNIIISL